MRHLHPFALALENPAGDKLSYLAVMLGHHLERLETFHI
jgi:hypothetical protein